MKRYFSICLTIILLTLIGCGQTNTPVSEIDTLQYTAVKKSVSLADGGPIRVWTETPTQLLYVATNIESNISQNRLFVVDKTSLVDRYLTEPFSGVKITLEDGTYPAVIYSDGETQATIMSVRKSDTDYAVYLQRYQFDGTFLDTLDISDTINTEFSPEESVSFTNAVTDVQGNQYFLYNSTQKVVF